MIDGHSASLSCFLSDKCGLLDVGAPSLTRRRVCNLLVQLLPGLARGATLGSKSRRTRDHILLSHLRLTQPEGLCPSICIPQEQGGPVIPPGHWDPFSRLLRLIKLRRRYASPPPHWNCRYSNVQ
jgi:hypothetical protein